MLYKILYFPARLAIRFYCRKIFVNRKEMLLEKGPLLIAANHPNSFLDAILVATLFRAPVYSLARGDAFSGKFFTTILRALNMLPVYRISEGAANLEHNYNTFEICRRLFAGGKIVLIFAEGRCVNEWHLRPLKKGTARLAAEAWKNNIPLRVLPLGINYSSFRVFGKNVWLNFGNILTQNEFAKEKSDGQFLKAFNHKLQHELQSLVIEIADHDIEKRKKQLKIKQSLLKKTALFIPAIIGLIVHAPLYLLIHRIIHKRARDHYDSIMAGALFLFYPLYLLVLTAIVFSITKSAYALLLVILLPFFAWSFVQIKNQVA